MNAATMIRGLSRRKALLSLLVGGAMMLPSFDAHALPGFSRKYKVSCTTCHAPTFARLNDYGERFAWKGYQNPDNDEPDGGTQGMLQLGDNLSLPRDVGHWFSARLNVTPVEYNLKSEVRNGETGLRSDSLNLGKTSWLQLFVAGSISKNLSIYIENEITSTSTHFSWYYLGFHNLADTTKLNFQVGRLSEVYFAPYNDRLPQLPAISGGVMRISSSNGAGQASNDLRSKRHGIQYYGYEGPVLWYGGVNNGPSENHPTDETGYWVGGRYSLQGKSERFDGSAVGMHFSGGTDTANSTLVTHADNRYYRLMPSFAVRYKDKVDFQGAYVLAHENNFNLGVPGNEKSVNYQGVRLVGSYFYNPKWAYSAHYDWYRETNHRYDLLPKYEFLYFPVVTYFLRENVRVTLYPGWDLAGSKTWAAGEDRWNQKHTFFVNIRVVF